MLSLSFRKRINKDRNQTFSVELIFVKNCSSSISREPSSLEMQFIAAIEQDR